MTVTFFENSNWDYNAQIKDIFMGSYTKTIHINRRMHNICIKEGSLANSLPILEKLKLFENLISHS